MAVEQDKILTAAVVVMQMIPQLSPTPWITTVAPLLFVLFLNGMKVTPCATTPWQPQHMHLVSAPTMSTPHLPVAQELLDDVRRHRSDSVVNHRLVTMLRASCEVQARWQELRIGDVVKVYISLGHRLPLGAFNVLTCPHIWAG